MSQADGTFVSMGEVVKAIGLKGELKFYPLLDFFPPVLDSAFAVWEDGTPAKVCKHRPAGSCVAVTVEGIGDRNGAEAAVGRQLGFLRGSYRDPDFPRPAEGLPFRYLDRPVETVSGQKVGTVEEVRLGGALFLLVVPAEGGQILIPSVEPILRFDDDLEGVLVIDPPEGLLDVQSG